MANPKYIDESLLPDAANESSKKVTKKAYSFRCDETLLEDMTTYADKEGISLPQLLSNIMDDFLHNKTLTNTYLPEYEGQYINIRSNVKNNPILFEYEIRYIMNNLDVWDSRYGYTSMNNADNKIKSMVMAEEVIHEGIDFLVIPETVHVSKLPDDAIMGGLTHIVNLNNIPHCLYCMYITVTRNGTVNYEVISWIDAMNKLKAVERYDLISHANAIKKELNKLHETYINKLQYYEKEIVDYNIYGNLLNLSNDFNTGAIVPASNSIDNIEYAAIIKKLPDNYALINKLMKENNELKYVADELQTIKQLLSDIDNVPDEELLHQFHKSRSDK